VPGIIGAVGQQLGRRGACLLFLGLLKLTVAFSLVNPPGSAAAITTYHVLELVVPLAVWSLVWAAVGAVCLLQAWSRTDRAAFTAASAIWTAWGLLYALAWVAYGVPRAWVGASIWFALAAFIQVLAGWPEPEEANR
jgi:hypothetical protein